MASFLLTHQWVLDFYVHGQFGDIWENVQAELQLWILDQKFWEAFLKECWGFWNQNESG